MYINFLNQTARSTLVQNKNSFNNQPKFKGCSPISSDSIAFKGFNGGGYTERNLLSRIDELSSFAESQSIRRIKNPESVSQILEKLSDLKNQFEGALLKNPKLKKASITKIIPDKGTVKSVKMQNGIMYKVVRKGKMKVFTGSVEYLMPDDTKSIVTFKDGKIAQSEIFDSNNNKMYTKIYTRKESSDSNIVVAKIINHATGEIKTVQYIKKEQDGEESRYATVKLEKDGVSKQQSIVIADNANVRFYDASKEQESKSVFLNKQTGRKKMLIENIPFDMNHSKGHDGVENILINPKYYR